ncbi:hypothetical protein [Streptomyces lavendulocolor]|uniref:hypothetical protein n=1 Tax=Streptomyces lavendulocolor TaxID=67316 RepID=UPI003C2AB52F
MAGTDFPDDLRAAQTRLHRATAELAALCRKLPWSVEPLPGRPCTTHPHTGHVTAGRADSPGWTEEEKRAVARLRTECVELSLRISTHGYWYRFEVDERVRARSELKDVTRRAATPPHGITEAA